MFIKWLLEGYLLKQLGVAKTFFATKIVSKALLLIRRTIGAAIIRISRAKQYHRRSVIGNLKNKSKGLKCSEVWLGQSSCTKRKTVICQIIKGINRDFMLVFIFHIVL